MLYFDPTYIFLIIGAIVSGIAALNVKMTYSRYNRVKSESGLTGAMAARKILDESGLDYIKIEHVSGNLTDHYSPEFKVLRLSDTVYNSTSVASIGVAAHECGHAIQDMEEYLPLKVRSVSVPVANIGSKLSWPIILAGLFLGYMQLARVGVLLFFLVVFFQLITLPVEFDASHRAIKVLEDSNMLNPNEIVGSKKVLRAAALTYVAALFTTIMSLVRMIILTRGEGREKD